MNEVKRPRKPLMFYYAIVLLALILFNAFVMPFLTHPGITEVDYSEFMNMTENKLVSEVMIEDNQILFKGKNDKLIGLKENVIIGKLIPAGTGMKRYKNIELDYGVNQEIMDNYEKEQERLRREAEDRASQMAAAEDADDEGEEVREAETEAVAEEVVELE